MERLLKKDMMNLDAGGGAGRWMDAVRGIRGLGFTADLRAPNYDQFCIHTAQVAPHRCGRGFFILPKRYQPVGQSTLELLPESRDVMYYQGGAGTGALIAPRNWLSLNLLLDG